jgi:hypothetical protein
MYFLKLHSLYDFFQMLGLHFFTGGREYVIETKWIRYRCIYDSNAIFYGISLHLTGYRFSTFSVTFEHSWLCQRKILHAIMSLWFFSSHYCLCYLSDYWSIPSKKRLLVQCQYINIIRIVQRFNSCNTFKHMTLFSWQKNLGNIYKAY